MHIWWVSYRFLFFLCRFESLDSTTSIVRFSFFFQYGFTSNKSSSLTLISNSFPHFLLASLSPFIHIYWCLLDGNIWSWRLMALYISLKKGKEKTLHTSSEPHLFPVCFFSADCFFFWTFSSSLSFFSPLCVISTESIIRGAVCLCQRGLGSAFDSALNWCRDTGYCLSFVMAMSDESGKKSDHKWPAFPLIALTYYKSSAV